MRVAWMILAVLLVANLLAHAGPIAAARSANGASQSGDPVVGSWSLRVEQPERPPAEMLGSFMSDGVYLQNDEPGASSAHGLWRRDQDGLYQLRFDLFTLAPQVAEESRVLLRVQVRGHVRMHG